MHISAVCLTLRRKNRLSFVCFCPVSGFHFQNYLVEKVSFIIQKHVGFVFDSYFIKKKDENAFLEKASALFKF